MAQEAPAGALPTLYAATARDVTGGDYFGPGGPFEMTGPPKKAFMSRHAATMRVRKNSGSYPSNVRVSHFLRSSGRRTIIWVGVL